MFKRSILVVFLGLTAMLPSVVRAADDKAPKSDKPAVFLRLAALDQFRANLRYLGGVVGEAEKAKQLDELVKSKLGEKGLECIDVKKPIGAYGWIGAFGIDSKAVILLPIANQKGFVDLLADTLDAKPQKGDDNVYTMNLDILPFPLHFRFANGYVYATIRDKEVLDKDKLLAPEAVFPGERVGTVSMSVNLDQVPEDLKEKALLLIENQLAGIKDKEMPSHSEAQKKFHEAAVDELSAQIKSLFKHGGETTLRLDLDRGAGDLALTMSAAAKPGSPLASRIRELGQVQSRTVALLHADSALRGELSVSLPQKLRDLLGPALKDAEKQFLAHAKDENEREVLNTILIGVMPTLKAAELDTAIDLRGPNSKGIYTLIAGLKIKEGTTFERNFLKAAAHFPQLISLDADKVDQVHIHRINPDKKLKSGTRRMLGDNPIYLAFGENVLLLGAGEKGFDALKEALATTPGTGKVLELQMSVSKMVTLFDDPKQAAAARQVFGDGKGEDRLRLSVEGGDALTLRLSLKAKLIDYIHRVEKAKKQ